MRRSLLVVGGGSSFVIPPIPEKDRWVRQGAVLTATESWESTGVLEPCVLDAGGDNRKMWYRGGGLHGPTEQLGYATSADGGMTWSKYGSNPILGSGTNGEASGLICPNVHEFGGTTYIYYSAPDSGKWKVAASSDGLPPYTITDTGFALPSGCTFFGNQSVWLDGSTYRALVEAYHSPSTSYRIYLASSSSPASGWSDANGGNHITAELDAGNGGAGGPDVHVIDGNTHVWYQSGLVGTVPPDSDIFRAYTPNPADLTDWTIVTPNPILTHTGTDYEIDQVADPCIIEASGRCEMYYDADDNATDIAAIKLATFDGTLSQLVNGT